MPRNFFISGMPKAGKTTLLRRIIKELKSNGLKVGGFVSPEEKHHGTRTAFYVSDVENGRSAILASVTGSGPKVSKYYVNVSSFEGIAIPAMRNMDKYDVFVIDEIGRMEMKSSKFVSLLDTLFDSKIPVIASVHDDYIDTYGSDGEVILLTENNRESVFFDLVKKATSAYSGLKNRKARMPARKPQELRATMGKKMKKKMIYGKKNMKNVEKTAKRWDEPEELKSKKPAQKKGVFHHLRELLGF